ncbi:MAG TPA: DUF4149 domain-containing protein [Candidatus Angelobacter sp.]|jgi:hypothetical protein|nr:DUF4149 domain-containing protein [Candidatus Angelobacter sp.]
MTALRTLMLLALIVWIGGIIFFVAVLAPVVFSGVLPTRELAGNVVNPSLTRLHWMGLVSGLIFLNCSIFYNLSKYARAKIFSPAHVLVSLMLLLTAISQFGIGPKMQALRTEMGVIDSVSQNDARRVEFNRLHQRSTQAEGGVLLLGLLVVALTARQTSSS